MRKEPTQTESSYSKRNRHKSRYPWITISQEMIDEANRLIPFTRVKRTVASQIDTLTGHLGEFAFAQYFYQDWRKHRVGKNKGKADYEDIEIKTSAFPFNEKLNLLVREDYMQKRKPGFYIQIILDVNTRNSKDVVAGTKAYLCGYALGDDVDRAPKRDFGSKFGGKGGYQCRYINIKQLHPMKTFRDEYRKFRND